MKDLIKEGPHFEGLSWAGGGYPCNKVTEKKGVWKCGVGRFVENPQAKEMGAAR